MEFQTRIRFNEEWKVIVASKGVGNKASLTNVEYRDRLIQVRRLKDESRTAPISAKDQKVLNRYDIVFKGGREWLAKRQVGEDTFNLRVFVADEELFDVLHEAHLESNHGTEEHMLNKIRKMYCNVTRQAVQTYLQLCPHCYNPIQELEESPIAPTVAPMPPMPPLPQCNLQYGKWVYFGFIDMQCWARHGYKIIMVHWDVGTRLVHIVPLQSTHHVEVAISLLEIYASYGMPHYLDAPYSIQYITKIIDHIKSVWRSGVSINVRSRDDQGDLLNGWSKIQAFLAPYLEREDFRHNWPLKIKYIQFLINSNSGKVD
ncbi:MAG: hypothetical protein ACRYE7_01895 [Janthinobacterium lividum]